MFNYQNHETDLKNPPNCISNRNEKNPQKLNEPYKIVILHVSIYILRLKNATNTILKYNCIHLP